MAARPRERKAGSPASRVQVEPRPPGGARYPSWVSSSASPAPPFDRARFVARLAGRTWNDRAVPGGRRASVAALIRWPAGDPEVLLMRRAEFAGDRWSGQVSLPGGREDPGDEDLVATAVRETREELGVDLRATATPLGRLDTIQAVARGRLLPLTIAPFVFAEDTPSAIVANHEVAAWFWLPLARAAAGALDGEIAWSEAGASTTLPAWHFDGQVIWGLTLKVLHQLVEIVIG
jgi:8-oxo-dGTP pyrophosphatase MutT (NUDIX family)